MFLKLLKKHFLENKLVFIIFVVCQIISLLVTLFIVNLSEIRKEYIEYSNSVYRTVSVVLNSENDGSMEEKINSLFGNDLMSEIETIQAKIFYENMLADVFLYSDEDLKQVVEAGKNLTEKQINGRDNVAIVNPRRLSSGENIRCGDTISFLNNEYTVVGLSSNINDLQIPTNSEINNRIKSLSIIHKNMMSEKETNQLVEEIERLFPGCSVQLLKKAPNETFEITSDDIMIFMGLVIANINFFALYYYILDNDKRRYAIFKLSGCSNIKGGLMLFAELGAVCIVSFVISLILFSTFATNIFSYIQSMIMYRFSVLATLKSFVIYMLSLVVIFVPIIHVYNKKSPNRLYNEEEAE